MGIQPDNGRTVSISRVKIDMEAYIMQMLNSFCLKNTETEKGCFCSHCGHCNVPFSSFSYLSLFSLNPASRHLQKKKTSSVNILQRCSFESAAFNEVSFGWVCWKIAINHCLSLWLLFRLTEGENPLKYVPNGQMLNPTHVSSIICFCCSCPTVLPHLPSAGANRRQTCAGTLHLRAFPRGPASCVSPSAPRSTTFWSHLRTHLIQPCHSSTWGLNFLPVETEG